MGLPLLGYARVSTEEQSERGLSLDAQCAAIRGYCAARGLALLDILVDPAVSGSVELAKRPAGAQLLRHLQSGQVGGVVVTKLDRAFRDTIDCLTIAREWDDLGVGLHLLDIGGMSLDTRSAIGRYFLTMLAGFAELERGLIAERIRAALSHKAAAGWYWTGPVPFAMLREYRMSDGRRHAWFKPDPELQPRLIEMFERIAGGETATAVARWLNQLEQAHGRGATWNHATVFIVVENPVYIGMAGGRRKRFDLRAACNIEPSVPLALWQRAQDAVMAQRRFRPAARGAQHALSGLLICGCCGGRVWTSGVSPKGEHHRYYRCANAKYGRGCEQPSAQEAKLLQQVIPELIRHLDPALVREAQLSNDRDDEHRERRLLELDQRLERLTDAYQDPRSGITLDEYVCQTGPLRAERERLSAPIPPRPGKPLPQMTVPELRELVDGLSGHDLRHVLSSYIDSMLLQDGKITEIRWLP